MSTKSFSYLALGDSYTKGEGVEVKYSFPYLLVDTLKNLGLSCSELKVIAQTGWTTADLKQAIEKEQIQKQYDIVTLLIGVNNQYQGKSLSEYEIEFHELLTIAIRLVGGDVAKVFVLSIPDYGYTPFGLEKQNEISVLIDQFNTANKKISSELHVNYFDITPITRQGLQYPNLVTTDVLHPSGLCYALWVNQIFYTIQKRLIQ